MSGDTIGCCDVCVPNRMLLDIRGAIIARRVQPQLSTVPGEEMLPQRQTSADVWGRMLKAEPGGLFKAKVLKRLKYALIRGPIT